MTLWYVALDLMRDVLMIELLEIKYEWWNWFKIELWYKTNAIDKWNGLSRSSATTLPIKFKRSLTLRNSCSTIEIDLIPIHSFSLFFHGFLFKKYWNHREGLSTSWHQLGKRKKTIVCTQSVRIKLEYYVSWILSKYSLMRLLFWNFISRISNKIFVSSDSGIRPLSILKVFILFRALPFAKPPIAFCRTQPCRRR